MASRPETRKLAQQHKGRSTSDEAVDTFAQHLRDLRVRRVETRGPRRRRMALSPAQRRQVLDKTDGRCHICGGEVDGRWQADHVLSHAHMGGSFVDNYLAAHATCNNYRWDYLPEEFELILKLGVMMCTQVANGTTLGRAVAAKFLAHERGRERRRQK